MIELQSKKMQYVETIADKFPHTLFVWCFVRPNETELSWTNPKVYKDINLNVFWRKPSIFRGALWDKYTDELRLDFDYSTMEDNIKAVSETLIKLKQLGIDKYLLYETGGKGIHLQLRYSFEFGDFDRADVRRTLFNCLDLNIDVDPLLFRTGQILGLESFAHRKTNNPKQLITVSNNKITRLNKGLEFDYLTDVYINYLPKDLINSVVNVLSKIDKPKKPLNLNHSPPAFYNSKSFTWHYNRFKFMYLNLEGYGFNRTQDMFIRWVYLTTKNEEVTRYYYKLFCDEVGIGNNLDTITSRVNATIKSMSANAIFIYKEVFSKEDFYADYVKEVVK